jgi:signal peptidase
MLRKGYERKKDRGDAAGAVFFAAYVGPSMNPTLREPEIMEVVPYDGRPMRVGDVAIFMPPQAERPVVHRIVRVTPAGISTIGDNNTREDASLLQPENIEGRVVAAWSGRKRRKIAGGLQGRLTNRRLRWRCILDRGVSRLLHPLYHALSRRGWIAKLLPAPFRPRVVVFEAQGEDLYRLLLGQHVIGQYDERKREWRIRRPFRLFVDERTLQRRQEENRTG